jgi:uncharacterized pyridoxamine 5'-phosphate oxidase family protein
MALPADLIDFLTSHPVVQVATVDAGVPRVRAMLPFRVDATGIWLGTLRSKDLCRQLERSPRVELCCVDLPHNRQLRINGLVIPSNDATASDAMLRAFAFLQPAVDREGIGVLRIFRLERGEYRWWDAATGVGQSAWLPFAAG